MKRSFPLLWSAVVVLGYPSTWPATAGTFNVETAVDSVPFSASVPGSLRWAIERANATPGVDFIAFAIAGNGPHTIQPLWPLPLITDPVTIDGTTQLGYSGTPLIQLDGAKAGDAANGLWITSGGCTLRALAITRFHQSGIRLEGDWDAPTGGNRLLGNFVGVEPDGITPAGNGTQTLPQYPDPAGILAFLSDNNEIGDGTPAGRNIVSGNKWGINLQQSSFNTIDDNFIGTDASGVRAISNAGGVRPLEYDRGYFDESGDFLGYYTYPTAAGVRIETAFDNTVRNNLISGNWTDVSQAAEWSGFWQRACGVFAQSADRTILAANRLGTDLGGSTAIPNQWGGWIFGRDCVIRENQVSGNEIFGLVMSNSGQRIERNRIGTTADGLGALGNGDTGLYLMGSDDSRVSGNLVSCNGQYGIMIGGMRNRVEGNFIGTDATGGEVLGAQHTGLFLANWSAEANVVGGTSAEQRNVLAGNQCNLRIGWRNNMVIGNFIGTDVTGTKALSRGDGVYLADIAQDNLVGGSSPAERNLISGNPNCGVNLVHWDTHGNQIRGNFIGTDVTGTLPVPNGWGVAMGQSTHDNAIGGEVAGAGNVVAYNRWGGVVIGFGSWEGTAPYAVGNRILGNRIHSNGFPDGDRAYGIHLLMPELEWTVIPNDPLDADQGVNGLQNFPVIRDAATTPRGTTVRGTLDSTPNTVFRIEFFANIECDPSGYGEGQDYLGYAKVATDSDGAGTFEVVLPGSAPEGSVITATATDPAGNTSPFSACSTPVVVGVIGVAIDIKPGSFPNSINLSSNGTVPVAILSSATFDAASVEPFSLTLAGAAVKLKGKGRPMAALEDINGDGRKDLVVHVLTSALQLSATDTQAVLNGQTLDGTPIQGTDSVRIIP